MERNLNCGGNEGAGQTDAYNFIHHISQPYQQNSHADTGRKAKKWSHALVLLAEKETN